MLGFSSITVTICLLISVCVIQCQICQWVRKLHKRRYWDIDESPPQELGWELVHGDIFRTPPKHQLFIFIIANGYHLLLFIIFFAVMIAICPKIYMTNNTNFHLLFAFTAMLNGYYAMKLLKMFGEYLIDQTILWIFQFIWYFLTALCLSTDSNMLIITISTTLLMHIIGIRLSLRQYRVEFPCPTNQLLRMYPNKPWYFKDIVYFCGIAMVLYILWQIICSVCFLELQQFDWQSLKHFDTLHRSLWIIMILILMLLHLAQITAISILYQINCTQDWQWWWKSTLMPAFLSCCIFISICWNEYQQFGNELRYIDIFLTITVIFMILSCIGYNGSFWLLWALYEYRFYSLD